jgi:geranylgeranylglycerol-phosphate geranylgeranyltransferase
MSKLIGYLRLMRPVNCFMMALAVIVGAALASPTCISSAWLTIVFGCITGFALTAASMATNDYYDRAIDAINEPKRPIPSGLIGPREALGFAAILTAIGFVAAYLTNTVYPLPLLTAIVAWAMFTIYTTVGKRSGLPGNLLVSACVAIPFIYGSVAVTARVELNVLLFAMMAFLSNTGREVTKGIVDVRGDKSENVKTLAVRYGEKKAAAVAIVFFSSAVLLSPIPWFMKLVSVWFVPFVLVTDIGLVVSSFMLFRDHSREKARKIKNTVLIWFVFGLLAFIFGLLRWP